STVTSRREPELAVTRTWLGGAKFMTSPSYEWDRVPAIVRSPGNAKFAETYGFAGSSGEIALEGQFLLPRGKPSETLYLFMHPSGLLHMLPMPAAVASAGLHVLCAGSRYPKNDSGLIMEKVALDMGAWVRDAHRRGYSKVILVG